MEIEARNRKTQARIRKKHTFLGKIDQVSYQRISDHPVVHVSIVNALYVTTRYMNRILCNRINNVLCLINYVFCV